MKKAPIESHAFFIGIIHAKKETTLYAESSGTVEKVMVTSGSLAEKNQLLASLKSAPTRRSLELAQASVHLAKERLERLQSLKKSGFSSKAELEKMQREMLEAEIMVQKASRELEQTQFVMPFKGLVGVYKVKEGSFVTAGDEVVSVYDPEDLLIDIHIPEEMLPLIQTGQKVTIAGESGEIASVQKIIDPETHMGLARIDFSGKEGVIGSCVAVDLLLERKEESLIIPKEAVFYQEDTAHVYIIQDQKAQVVKVKVGLENEDMSEILDGLKEGDLVILRGQISLYDGRPVKAYSS